MSAWLRRAASSAVQLAGGPCACDANIRHVTLHEMTCAPRESRCSPWSASHKAQSRPSRVEQAKAVAQVQQNLRRLLFQSPWKQAWPWCDLFQPAGHGWLETWSGCCQPANAASGMLRCDPLASLHGCAMHNLHEQPRGRCLSADGSAGLAGGLQRPRLGCPGRPAEASAGAGRGTGATSSCKLALRARW